LDGLAIEPTYLSVCDTATKAVFYACSEGCMSAWLAGGTVPSERSDLIVRERVVVDTFGCVRCCECGVLLHSPWEGCVLHEDCCPVLDFMWTDRAVEVAQVLLGAGMDPLPWPVLEMAADLWDTRRMASAEILAGAALAGYVDRHDS